MYLGRVVGTVVASQKVSGLEGKRLLVVQPIDHLQKASGPLEVAVDCISASPNSIVMLENGREAALACDPSFVPVDAAIIGIVDEINS